MSIQFKRFDSPLKWYYKCKLQIWLQNDYGILGIPTKNYLFKGKVKLAGKPSKLYIQDTYLML